MAQAARLASRLQRELKMLQSDPPPGVSAWPCDGHLLTHLQAQLHGPEGTVYENGVFKLDVQVPERYPFEPPSIKFITPVYHPNIDNGGRICLDLLNLPPKGAWRPSLNLSTLLASIGLLLADPNPDDGLMGDITAEYKHDRFFFNIKARNWTKLYASQDQVQPEFKLPDLPANAEPSQDTITATLHGQKQAQASRSFEEHMNLNCSTSLQPLRRSLSLSKGLTFDRGTACCDVQMGDIVEEMAANRTLEAVPSRSTSMKRSSKVSESCQSDGRCIPSAPKCIKVFDAQGSDDRRGPTFRKNCKDFVSAGKENQTSKLCLAAKPKDGNFKHPAGEEKSSGEGVLMEVSSNLNSSPCLNLVHNQVGKDRSDLCLPPRTTSLSSIHVTEGQQNIWAEKQPTTVADKKIHTAVSGSTPVVVISDSESDSEPSTERFILFSTRINLNNKRRAKLKLR